MQPKQFETVAKNRQNVYLQLFTPLRLAPPKNPAEAIQSRRNPCHGFVFIADIQEHAGLVSCLEETRDAILKVVDPDRDAKPHPRHSPLYIKQKFFHAAVFSVPPLLRERDFVELYTNKHGLLNRFTMDDMCDRVHAHLQKQKPVLEPMVCEMMPDGTILARFKYKTETEDEAPLRTLGNQIDPEGNFAKWDANPARYKTVTVALCVIDKDKMPEKCDAIQVLLNAATYQLKVIGDITINHFQFISHYDKRTLSLKHTSMYASVGSDGICKI